MTRRAKPEGGARHCLAAFLADRSGMSRIDCGVILLMLLALAASLLYLFGGSDAPDKGETTAAAAGAAEAAEPAFTLFGLTTMQLGLIGLAILAALVVFRIVAELRR